MILGAELNEVLLEGRKRFVGRANPKDSGLREWLSLGTGHFVKASTSSLLRVEALDDGWANANGADCQRFFWAARDSIVPRHSAGCDPKSIGWASVQIYYACLYTMLGLMRGLGKSLLYLGRDDCARICKSPGAAPLGKGVYELRIDLASRASIELQKKNSGGFHESFWRWLDDQLSLLSVEMAQGGGMFSAFSPRHLQSAILSVEDLRNWLGKNGSPGRSVGWMSSLRNEVNYRLTRSSWTPTYKQNGVEVPRLRQDVVSIVRGNSDKLGASLKIDDDLRAMIERTCVIFRSLANVMQLPGSV